MCKERETYYSASKKSLSLNSTQTPDWFALQFSCHPISKDKGNSKFADATPE
jgi:hypothetical protein